MESNVGVEVLEELFLEGWVRFIPFFPFFLLGISGWTKTEPLRGKSEMMAARGQAQRTAETDGGLCIEFWTLRDSVEELLILFVYPKRKGKNESLINWPAGRS